MATEKEKYISEAKMAEKPVIPARIILKDMIVKNRHLDSNSVSNRVLQEDSVTPNKLSEDLRRKFELISTLDSKYGNITDELYSMVRSLQVGGVALSQGLGTKEDIGISQKTLTDQIRRIWDKLEEMTGESFFEFDMTAVPEYIGSQKALVNVTADSSTALSYFESIRIYCNEELVAEDASVATFSASFEVDRTSVIKCIATIAGKPFTREKTIFLENYDVLYIGAGDSYTDILDDTHKKIIEGTIEDTYEVAVPNDGKHIILVLPKFRSRELSKITMSGYDIPMTTTEVPGFMIYTSANVYIAGTYYISLDVES